MKKLILFVTILLAKGCTLAPEFTVPEPHTLELSDGLTVHADEYDDMLEEDISWWTHYHDPVLANLLDIAHRQNISLKQAVLSIEQNRLARKAISSKKVPFINAGALASRQKASTLLEGLSPPPGTPNQQNVFNLGLNLTWELDVFGRVKGQENALDFEIEASQMAYRDLMVSLFAEVGITYTRLKRNIYQRSIMMEVLFHQAYSVELNELLAQQQLVDETHVLKMRSLLEANFMQLAMLENEHHQLLAGLANLLSTTPKHVETLIQDIENSNWELPDVPIGIPSTTLQNRADVKQAMYRLKASNERIGVQIANKYPAFSITGAIGQQSADISDLFESASQAWSLGSVLSWPIFDGGIRALNVQLAQSQFSIAELEYERVYINAVSEVEAALSAYVFSKKELQAKQNITDMQNVMTGYQQQMYEQGLVSKIALIESEQTARREKMLLLLNKESVAISQIEVYRAFGGAWL
jgi:NodT family efflux transporter outer membrane factor (OMF) lipoprotein